MELNLSLNIADIVSSIIDKGNGKNFIISYSDGRAKNNAFNRNPGFKKLEKALDCRKLFKACQKQEL